jgi:hypothetical protein
MSFQTYTITSASFEAEAGDNISAGANPTVTLVISPAAGYTLTHTNFSIGEALPTEVASAVFSQDGDNVNCLVTFAAGFVMPSADVELLIDIDGTADEQTFTIDGNYITTETNTTGTSGTTAFSQSGTEGTVVTLFTKTFTASTNYYFENEPYYYQDPAASGRDAYEITWVDSSLGDNLTARTYTVKYTIGTENKTLNDLYFVASASLLYVAPGTPLLNSYFVNPKNYANVGETRVFKFYGDAGADFTLTTTTAPTTWSPASLTLDSNGYLEYAVIVGENSSGSDRNWSYTLGGDIASPFPQSNPFTITQPST